MPKKIKSVFVEKPDAGELKKDASGFLQSRRLSVAMDYLEPQSRVLEVGSSYGYTTYYMAKHKKCKVDAYELNEERLSLSKKYFKHPNIRYFGDNILKIKGKGIYDAIVMLEVIEHVENPYQYLSRLFTFLKKGGYLIISTPNANDYLQAFRNLRLYFKKARWGKARYIQERNRCKYGNMDDHIYCWSWESFYRLIDRIGFEYIDSDIVGFRSPSYGKYHLFKGDVYLLEFLFKPFCTNLVFKVRKPL